MVDFEEGTDLAKGIGAAGYFETSALRGEGLEELFDACLGIGVEKWRTKAQKEKVKVIVLYYEMAKCALLVRTTNVACLLQMLTSCIQLVPRWAKRNPIEAPIL